MTYGAPSLPPQSPGPHSRLRTPRPPRDLDNGPDGLQGPIGGRAAMNDDELRRDLLARIEARREEAAQYVRRYSPRMRRWANATIVLTSLAAVSTAGPAFGGKTFAQSVQDLLGLASSSSVWRMLCLLALLVSAAAAVMTSLSKSEEAARSRLTLTEAAKAELAGLATLVRYGELPLEDAVKLFHEYSVRIPWVDDALAPTGSALSPGWDAHQRTDSATRRSSGTSAL